MRELRLTSLSAAIALAGATSIGGLAAPAVQSAAQSIFKTIYPDPDRYLEGHYKGDWTWTETVGGVQTPKETHDEVFINTIEGGVLTGVGSDPQYGRYTISGHVRGNEINGTYISDTDSLQPSASGLFFVDISKNGSNVVLEGAWHGVNRESRTPIAGRVTLTAQFP